MNKMGEVLPFTCYWFTYIQIMIHLLTVTALFVATVIMIHLYTDKSVEYVGHIVNTKYKYKYRSLLCSVCLSNTRSCYCWCSYCYWFSMYHKKLLLLLLTTPHGVRCYFYWFSVPQVVIAIGSPSAITVAYLQEATTTVDAVSTVESFSLLLMQSLLLWTVPLYCGVIQYYYC